MSITPTVRLGFFFALGAFLGGSAFAVLLTDFGAADHTSSVATVCAYAAVVALLLAVAFTVALKWLRAAGRVVTSNMSWTALICGAAFGSPVAVLPYPPVLNSRLLAAAVIAVLVSSVAAFIVTAPPVTRHVDGG